MPTFNAHELPQLSNEDIEILYDIVNNAESLPGPPFRALFTAYDRILAENGINPDNDQIYFRFLFHMQEDRSEHESLLSRFKNLLAQMGIEIEADPEGEGVEEITRNIEYTRSNEPYSPAAQERLTPSRRASFSTFYDVTTEKLRDATRRERGRLPPYGRANGEIRSSASELGSRRPRSHSNSAVSSQVPVGGRVNGRVSSDLPMRPRRSGSVSSQGSLRITRNGNGKQDDYWADESEVPSGSSDFAGPERQHEPAEHYIPQEVFYRPSDTQMVRDAETFDYHRTLIVTRRHLKMWRAKARDVEERTARMYSTAAEVDRNALLRQSVDAWRAALLEKRRVAETERFFSHLADRAGKARDLFLLTKAFTHWAQCASDEVQRTSVARRHILRTKYFNAWRDITAVNELKVRRHGLQKFLYTWRQRTAAVQNDSFQALVVYQKNLVHRVYWKWFWTFCERRAPVWSRGRLRRTVFTKWKEIAKELKEREIWVDKLRKNDLQRKMLQRMKDKLAAIRNLEPIAQEFRKIATLSSAFYPFKRAIQFAPKLGQVTQRIDSRVLHSTFQTWKLRAQQERRAVRIDKMRILRNTWTAWNDRLRIQSLAVQINDRILVQALYKWALASRESVFIRVQDAKRKESVFHKWLGKARSQQSSLKVAERRFTALRRRRLLRACVDRLETATVAVKDLEHIAMSVYNPKILRNALDKVTERHEHISQLDQWAEDARFFVLTSTCLKRWKEATQHSRRNRRREAYAVVRRGYKLNLVKNAFAVWKGKTSQLEARAQQAGQVYQDHVRRKTAQLVTNWRDHVVALRNRANQAAQMYHSKLSSMSLTYLRQRLASLQSLDRRALALRQESIDITASACFKKLEWRLFQVQRGEQNALALRQRNFEKHFRAMVRFWTEQTSDRRAQRGIPPSPTAGQDRDDEPDDGGGGEDDENDTRRLEAWTAFDAEGLGLSASNIDLSLYSPQPPAQQDTRSAPPENPPSPSPQHNPPPIPELGIPFATSTPMPGYLRTPSKRSVARLKRQLDLGDTHRIGQLGVASAPAAGFRRGTEDVDRVTSFQSRLRQGGYTGRGPGRGKTVGFRDIQEEGDE
jgi:protein SFI1